MDNIPQIAKYVIIILAVCAIVYFFVTFTGIPIPPAIWYIILVVIVALFCLWAINVISGRGNTPSI